MNVSKENVIARSEATWQSPVGWVENPRGDSHVGPLGPPRNDKVVRNGGYTNGRKKSYGQCNIYDENGKLVEYLGDINTGFVAELEERYFGA